MQARLRNIIIGTFLLSVFLLLIPLEAQGFVLDKFKLAAETLSTKTGPIASTFMITFFFFILGYVSLFISTFLLQGIIAATPIALTVTTGEAAGFVRMGWNFTSGIVNLILIIAFVVIAFAVIIGSEKIEMKKTLPKLIMVALLVNFTLLFVGIGIDISNILFNSIANQFLADGGIRDSVTRLFELSASHWFATLAYLTTTSYALTVPIVNIIVQKGWLIGLAFIIQPIVNFIVYGGIMFLLSGVFFLYFMVFLIRIFVIQILAVLAPLAFFCLIFDQTRKYWKQWSDALIEWLFVGVIFIFLMYFGITMAPLASSLADNFFDEVPGIFGWLLGTVLNIIGEIFLLVYFIVIAFIAKSFVPAAVNTVISQVSRIEKMATPWAGAIASGTATKMANDELKRGERIKNAPESGGRWEMIRHTVSANISRATRKMYNVAGTTVEEVGQKAVEKNEAGFKKDHRDNYDAAIEVFNSRSLKGLITDDERVAFLRFVAEGGAKVLEKLPLAQLAESLDLARSRGDAKTIINVTRNIPTTADVDAYQKTCDEIDENADPEGKEKAKNNLDYAKKIKKAITQTMKRDYEEDLDKLETELNLATGDAKRDIETKISDIKNKIKNVGDTNITEIYRLLIRSLKASDVENLSSSTLKNKEVQKIVFQEKNLNFIRAIGQRKDAVDIVKSFNETAEDVSLDEVNANLYNDIKTTPAGQALCSTIFKKIQEKGKRKNI